MPKALACEEHQVKRCKQCDTTRAVIDYFNGVRLPPHEVTVKGDKITYTDATGFKISGRMGSLE